MYTYNPRNSILLVTVSKPARKKTSYHQASLEKLIVTCAELGWGLGMEDFESM